MRSWSLALVAVVLLAAHGAEQSEGEVATVALHGDQQLIDLTHRKLKGAAEDHDHHDHDHGHKDHEEHAHGVEDDHGHGHDEAHEHGHDHDHGHGHAHETKASARKLETRDRFSIKIWTEALFATALVGAAPVITLFFVPLGTGSSLHEQEAQKPLLRVFLSFAAGGLLGDALLHLLPHSMPGHDHSDHGHASHAHHDHGEHEGHSHSVQDLTVWLWTIAGMMTFLMLEKFVRAQTSGGHGHSHSHSHGHAREPMHKINDAPSSARKRTTNKPKDDDDEVEVDSSIQLQGALPAKQPIAAAGYLNLAADVTHNFTDGLAIGATFLRGSGWQTTVAMLLHELPHEIGDFAILIQSGFTRREAMCTQLLTAIGAMIGTVIGLLMEGAGDSSSAWISPFTAGGFIYIACASVMPELLEDCSLVQSLKECAAMITGIGLMVVIALNE